MITLFGNQRANDVQLANLLGNLRVHAADFQAGHSCFDGLRLASGLRSGVRIPGLQLAGSTVHPKDDQRFSPLRSALVCRSQIESRHGEGESEARGSLKDSAASDFRIHQGCLRRLHLGNINPNVADLPEPHIDCTDVRVHWGFRAASQQSGRLLQQEYIRGVCCRPNIWLVVCGHFWNSGNHNESRGWLSPSANPVTDVIRMGTHLSDPHRDSSI